jgi:hypothetical protein
MKCPKCGYEPPMGRPKEINETELWNLKRQGKSLRAIAQKMGFSHGAIKAAIDRHFCVAEYLNGECVDCGRPRSKHIKPPKRA